MLLKVSTTVDSPHILSFVFATFAIAKFTAVFARLTSLRSFRQTK